MFSLNYNESNPISPWYHPLFGVERNWAVGSVQNSDNGIWTISSRPTLVHQPCFAKVVGLVWFSTRREKFRSWNLGLQITPNLAMKRSKNTAKYWISMLFGKTGEWIMSSYTTMSIHGFNESILTWNIWLPPLWSRPQVTAKALKNWWKNERQKLGIRQREIGGRPKLKRADWVRETT